MYPLLSGRFALIVVSILALAAEASEAATKRKANATQNQSGKNASAQSGNRRSADPNSGPRDPSLYRYDPVGRD